MEYWTLKKAYLDIPLLGLGLNTTPIERNISLVEVTNKITNMIYRILYHKQPV